MSANPPATPIVELTMLRLRFNDQLKELVRGVHELFPHMAEILIDEIVRHQKHTDVNSHTSTCRKGDRHMYTLPDGSVVTRREYLEYLKNKEAK